MYILCLLFLGSQCLLDLKKLSTENLMSIIEDLNLSTSREKKSLHEKQETTHQQWLNTLQQTFLQLSKKNKYFYIVPVHRFQKLQYLRQDRNFQINL